MRSVYAKALYMDASSTLDDLRALKTHGAVVGKALWEARFGLAEALDACA